MTHHRHLDSGFSPPIHATIEVRHGNSSPLKKMCALLHQDAREDYSSRQEFVDIAVQSISIEQAGAVKAFLDHVIADIELTGEGHLKSIWRHCNSDWYFLDDTELKALFKDFQAGLSSRLRSASS